MFVADDLILHQEGKYWLNGNNSSCWCLEVTNSGLMQYSISDSNLYEDDELNHTDEIYSYAGNTVQETDSDDIPFLISAKHNT